MSEQLERYESRLSFAIAHQGELKALHKKQLSDQREYFEGLLSATRADYESKLAEREKSYQTWQVETDKQFDAEYKSRGEVQAINIRLTSENADLLEQVAALHKELDAVLLTRSYLSSLILSAMSGEGGLEPLR